MVTNYPTAFGNENDINKGTPLNNNELLGIRIIKNDEHRTKNENENLKNQQAQQQRRKSEIIRRTLSEEYPGLDYLGFHNVLNAKHFWYRIMWFSVVTVCLFIGLMTIFRIIKEYTENPSATLINVKSVDKLLLPQLTVCSTNAATINIQKMEQQLFKNNSAAMTVVDEYSDRDLINFAYFMLAGSGFQKMDYKYFNDSEKRRLNNFYDRFRHNLSIDQFFNEFFDSFGLSCKQFFQFCQLGDTVLDCCKIFEPIYLIRRGRCFRSIKLYQRNFDELGKLRVQLRQPYKMDPQMKDQEEIMAFIAEYKPQLAPFPRHYLQQGTWTKMRLNAKHISLFPAEEVCSQTNDQLGKDTCYVENWLQTHVEGPLNCTFPYVQEIRKDRQLESCEPLKLVDNYINAVQTTNYTIHSCVLACDRWEYMVSIEKIDMSRVYKNVNVLPFIYRIDLSYNDLQYELIEEVSTLTLAGLIAQIGGQMSLFMGSSILNLIQATIMVILLLHRTYGRTNNQIHDGQIQEPVQLNEMSENEQKWTYELNRIDERKCQQNHGQKTHF
ncbi:hypothetical protein niasHT_038606 [Heterodera trifolii]|uniref:Uncharacterized protein n=2 Tax=Heterodera trifolii TaxID=157864 RepID=A0ABD2I317_9BILA